MNNKKSYLLMFSLTLIWVSCDEASSSKGETPDGGNVEDNSDDQVSGTDAANATDKESDTDVDGSDGGDDSSHSLCGTPEAVCPKGSFVECDDLDDPNLVGHLPAVCLDDCSGFDTSRCLSPEEMLPYGQVEIDLQSDFVLDMQQIGDVPYQDAHLDTIITKTPVFTGTIGDVAFPSDNAAEYEILVLRSDTSQGGEFAISQQGFDAEGELVNPSMHLKLPSDHYVTEDEIEVCLGQNVIIYIYELDPASFNIDCFHAVTADGAIVVDLAENLEQTDGGKLYLASKEEIPTYYMKNTPHGDLSPDLSYPVCNRLDEEKK